MQLLEGALLCALPLIAFTAFLAAFSSGARPPIPSAEAPSLDPASRENAAPQTHDAPQTPQTRETPQTPGFRYAFLAAGTLWIAYLTVITEGLSLYRQLTRPAVALAWALVVVIAAAAAFQRRRRASALPLLPPPWPSLKQLPGLDRTLILASAGILALIALTALLSPPNGSDQVEYHLPRIVQWTLHRSIAFFPTHYYNQLYPAPLAEWIMLHFYLLSNGDRLVNLVQSFAYAGCALAVSLIARELGASRRGQLLSALVAVTLPVGILEASGAKNDIVVSFWIAAAIALLLHWRSAPTWTNTALAGLALGAAVVTKGTAYMVLPPMVAACFFLTPRPLRARYLKRLPILVLLVLAMNAPQWIRNYDLAGSPLGLPAPDAAGRNRYAVTRYTPGSMAASLIKKSALHFGMPGQALNARMTSAFRGAIRLIGQDPDDPATCTPTSRFRIPQFNRNEYWAGNPLHFLLLLFAATAILLARPLHRRLGRTALPAGLAYFLAGLLTASFLVAVMTCWTLDAARLQTPLFTLGAPLIGLVVSSRWPRAVAPLAALLVLVALPFALLNEERPLISKSWLGLHPAANPAPNPAANISVFTTPRNRLLFVGDESYTDSSIAAAAAVRRSQCTDIGLDTSQENFDYEGIDYPLMLMAQAPTPNSTAPTHDVRPSVRYVGVHNLSAKYATPADLRPPCAVICVHCADNADSIAAWSPSLPQVSAFADTLIFLPAATSASGSAGPALMPAATPVPSAAQAAAPSQKSSPAPRARVPR